MHRYFFYALILLLPTQIGYHVWPAWASVLGRRLDYLSPTIYATDIVLFLVMASWISNTVSKINLSTPFGTRNQAWKYLLLLCFTVTCAGINILTASDPRLAFYKWMKVAEFTALGWYIVKTRPSVSVVTFFVSFAVLYSSVLAIVQFFLQHSLGGIFWFLGERTFSVDTPGIARFHFCQPSTVNCQLLMRPYATFPHPNVLGGFLAVALPLIIFNFQFFPRSRFSLRETIFKMITIVLGVIALSLTFSRSAWMGAGLGLGFVYYAVWKKNKSRIFGKIYALLPLLVAVIVLMLFIVFRPSATDETIVVRSELNTAAIKIWKEAPWFGTGLGNFLIKLPDAMVHRQIYFLQPVHNIYLLILAETGVLGLALFVLLLWIVFRGFVLRFSMYHVSCIILLILGFVDHYPFTIQQGQLLLTVFLAISAGTIEKTYSG